MSEKRRLQVPISTLCLIVAVVALGISLFLTTTRHNAQLMEQARRHNIQLVNQAAQFGAQTRELTARHNAQLKALAAEIRKERDGPASKVSAGDARESSPASRP